MLPGLLIHDCCPFWLILGPSIFKSDDARFVHLVLILLSLWVDCNVYLIDSEWPIIIVMIIFRVSIFILLLMINRIIIVQSTAISYKITRLILIALEIP